MTLTSASTFVKTVSQQILVGGLVPTPVPPFGDRESATGDPGDVDGALANGQVQQPAEILVGGLVPTPVPPFGDRESATGDPGDVDGALANGQVQQPAEV
ncbi:UNVERIFIED_CONTAM: hypothetical protein FKN15_037086 [Acipenser sinensis]